MLIWISIGLSATEFVADDVGETQPVAVVEAELGVALPAALSAALSTFNGPIRFDAEVGIAPLSRPSIMSGDLLDVDLIFGRNAGRYGLTAMADRYEGRVGSALRPIADAGAGDLYLWHTATGEVFFWHHECPLGEAAPEALTRVAASVGEFLEGLTARASEPVRSPKGLVSVQLDF